MSFYNNHTRTVTRNGFLGGFIYKDSFVICQLVEQISQGPRVKQCKPRSSPLAHFLQRKVLLNFSFLQVFNSINPWLSTSKHAPDRQTYNIWKIYVNTMYNARNVECITLSSVLMELLQQRTKSHNPEALFPTHSSNCFLFLPWRHSIIWEIKLIDGF